MATCLITGGAGNLACQLSWAPADPCHLHRAGVEIHRGYSPLHGHTILGEARAEVTEGYAMPVPPGTRHGYVNIGSRTHHVPFIFGSLTLDGWGVFLDVDARPTEANDIPAVPVTAAALNGTVWLEREIVAAVSKVQSLPPGTTLIRRASESSIAASTSGLPCRTASAFKSSRAAAWPKRGKPMPAVGREEVTPHVAGRGVGEEPAHAGERRTLGDGHLDRSGVSQRSGERDDDLYGGSEAGVALTGPARRKRLI